MAKVRKTVIVVPAGRSYKAGLRRLQIELVRAHRHIIRHRWRVLALSRGATRPARTEPSSASSDT